MARAPCKPGPPSPARSPAARLRAHLCSVLPQSFQGGGAVPICNFLSNRPTVVYRCGGLGQGAAMHNCIKPCSVCRQQLLAPGGRRLAQPPPNHLPLPALPPPPCRRFFAGPDMAGATLTVDACGSTGDSVVSALSTTKSSPGAADFTCIG